MPGSGGFGDPLERDSASALEDVRQDKMTINHAREVYGVVIDADTMTGDHEATAACRARARQNSSAG